MEFYSCSLWFGSWQGVTVCDQAQSPGGECVRAEQSNSGVTEALSGSMFTLWENPALLWLKGAAAQ